MLAGEKKLKDSEKDIVKDNLSVPASYEVKSFFSGSYTKTHKLITALYMVTDIMDKEEPIRGKLRNLGTEIISDIHSTPANTGNRISEIMSFLSIAGAMNFISEMNCAVLKKEFFELKNSIQNHTDVKPMWITEFLSHQTKEELDSSRTPSFSTDDSKKQSKGQGNVGKGQQLLRTRIGVQRGSTLMKVLSDKTSLLPNSNSPKTDKEDFNALKKQRRDDILNIIKSNGGGATIKDIKTKMDASVNGEISFSEKTLQRELLSLIKDGVLNKTGEKRWSRYFVR